MKNPHFELNSEQTLRLAELRDALLKALPEKSGERVEFPTALYPCDRCGHSGCVTTCNTSCYAQCRNNCSGSCTATCTGMCADKCTGVFIY